MKNLPYPIVLFILLISIALVPSAPACQEQVPLPTNKQPSDAGKELLPNPSFSDGAEGWIVRDGEALDDGGRDGGLAIRLQGFERSTMKWSSLGIGIESPPTCRKLHLALYMKGTAPGQTPMVKGQGIDGSGKMVGDWSEHFQLEQEQWILTEAAFVLPEEAMHFYLTVINYTGKDLFVSEASLMAGEAAKAAIFSLEGPGVLLASAATHVRPGETGKSGRVTFPIPGTYRSQIPLTFDIEVDPPEAFLGFRWKQREDGINWLCEINVQPPEDGAEVRWRSHVLVSDFEKRDLPATEAPEVPEGTEQWLRSTACVQCDDPAIQEKAEELAASTKDLEAYVKKVVQFTVHNPGKPGVAFDALDARKGLDCRGSCTSRANLAAALLRCRGIPARTLAHLPAWWKGPLYEHWLVEYWHPGAGWVWAESSTTQIQPPDWQIVVLNVANPEDEDRSFDTEISHSGVMLGAPYLAVHLISPELHRAFPKDASGAAAGNWSKCAMRARGTEEELKNLFETARSAYETLKENCMAGKLSPDRTRQVSDAVEGEDLGALRRALAAVEKKDMEALRRALVAGEGEEMREVEQALAESERWIDRPREEWPQITLINSIKYKDKTHPVAGCAFLLEAGGKVYAVTAKHVLQYFKSEAMDSVHFKGTLESWKMFPKNNPDDVVVVDRLINEDPEESLENIPPEKDWLIFTIQERSKNIQPLKFRTRPLVAGEKTYIVGWRYTDKDCTQRIYEGKFVRMRDEGAFLTFTPELADNTMPGLSGGPVIDAKGDLIGIMCRKSGKMDLPSSTKYPMELLGVGTK